VEAMAKYGLNDNVQAVKQEIAQDRSERNAKQKEKEFQKNYTTNLKVELGQFFYNYFKNSEDVGQALADLQKIENRENIIKGVFNSHTQKHGDRGKTQLNYMYEQELARIYKIFKNAAPKNQDDYKKQIALEKWDMQRQRELLKIKQLKQKIAQNEQKYNMKQPAKTIYKTSGSGGEVAKILLYLTFAPIAIFGLIIYGFISAAAKTK
jgi:hypothetical protein